MRISKLRISHLVAVVSIALMSLAAYAAPGVGPTRPIVEGEALPTGMKITPTAARGATFEALNPNLADLPDFVVGQAVSTAVSPDGNTLLVLTSGYNRNNGANGSRVAAWSNEYVFVFDIGSGRAIQRQALTVPNTFVGIAFHPSGNEFYVSGGVNDNVHVFVREGETWVDAKSPIALGHTAGVGLGVGRMAAGLGVTADGRRLVVANFQNDSVTLLDAAARQRIGELDLRPGKLDPAAAGVPGGEYPYGVAVLGNATAYVTSVRDREIVVVDLANDQLAVRGRIAVPGQPNKLVLDRAGRRLFVACDNSDEVVVVDTISNTIVETIALNLDGYVFPGKNPGRGVSPNDVRLSPDGRSLYVTCGGLNALAVVDLAAPAGRKVAGLVPTGHYPNASATTKDGRTLFVVNGKSNTGGNERACRDTTSIAPGSTNACNAANQYVWQLKKAGLLTLPVPTKPELAQLTAQVAHNANLVAAADWRKTEETLAFLRSKIKHVVYVIKENRTYDQVLGDLEKGNGDPSLCILPEPVTPNHHRLARQFVTFDNFLDSGETSNTGWNWTTAAMSSDFTEKTAPVNYAGRGLQYDWEGGNRNINVGLTFEERRALYTNYPDDRDMLAGSADVAAPDGPESEAGTGYLWDAALRAGKSIRNYGCFGLNVNRISRTPFADGSKQLVPDKKALFGNTDEYFRGYDMSNADFWLFKEWEREFDQQAAAGAMPNLTLIRLPHDHFGNYTSAIDGVNTIDTQMADNDYATGLIVEKIAKSPFRNDTLVFIIEDDAQNGPDHVDAHRSIAFIAGPYVARERLVSTHYTTVSLIRTMLEILGAEPLGLYDGLAAPMVDAFDLAQADWDFAAIVPEVLRTTQLPLPAKTEANSLPDTPYNRAFAQPRHDAAYWAEAMKGQDFSTQDQLDEAAFNRALWHGLMGADAPFPTTRSGVDLRLGREALLRQHAEGVTAEAR